VKKNGFTLIELMITIGLTGILLLGVSSALIFANRMSNGTIGSATTLLQVQSLRDFIITTNKEKDLVDENFLVRDKILYYFEDSVYYPQEDEPIEDETKCRVLFKHTNIENIAFEVKVNDTETKKVLKECTIAYKSDVLVFSCYGSYISE